MNSGVKKRKRFNRKQRLHSAKHWLPNLKDKHIAKAYRKRYGIDWVSAFIELEMLGVKIDPTYKENVLRSVRPQVKRKKKTHLQKATTENELSFDQDENFAYIAGYTSGGIPYGITRQEWESS